MSDHDHPFLVVLEPPLFCGDHRLAGCVDPDCDYETIERRCRGATLAGRQCRRRATTPKDEPRFCAIPAHASR